MPTNLRGQNLIFLIEEEMSTDDESLLKKGNKLMKKCEEATAEEREFMDDIFISLCGWSFDTLMKKSIE